MSPPIFCLCWTLNYGIIWHQQTDRQTDRQWSVSHADADVDYISIRSRYNCIYKYGKHVQVMLKLYPLTLYFRQTLQETWWWCHISGVTIVSIFELFFLCPVVKQISDIVHAQKVRIIFQTHILLNSTIYYIIIIYFIILTCTTYNFVSTTYKLS